MTTLMIKAIIPVNIAGMIQAAENLDKLGSPVVSLSKKVLALLTDGFVK